MEKLITSLFPMGQRKLIVSLIALAIAVIVDKFGGGLSESLTTSLIAIVAIFSGGNVLEHLADALKIVKGTKVWDMVDDYLPSELVRKVNGPVAPPVQEPAESDTDDVAMRINELEAIVAEQRAINEKNALSLQQLTQVVSNILNAQRATGGNVGPQR